jgi:hypothetical protein
MKYSVEIYFPNKPLRSKTVIVDSSTLAAERVTNNIYVNFTTPEAKREIERHIENKGAAKFSCNLINGAYIKILPYQPEINHGLIQNLIQSNLKPLLSKLSIKSATASHTKNLLREINRALELKDNDIISCLNMLVSITPKLVIVDRRKVYCEIKYPYQATSKLYHLLDAIRHEYRMLALDLKMNGIQANTSTSVNNIVIVQNT